MHDFRWIKGLLLLWLIPAMGISAFAETELDARLVIVGPGDPVYTYWGHIGIAIADSAAGTDLFYDFGNFSFHSENFYADFAMGRMLYLGMVVPTEYFLSYSLTEDRDLFVYPLDLSDDAARILYRRLQWWTAPENREYLYDYFYENCSTIIRDVLNEAVDGALEEFTHGKTDASFRLLTRTGAAPSRAAEIMLHYLLGPDQDRPIDEWEMMFLPRAVADIGSRFVYMGSDGMKRRLVGEPEILRTSNRTPVPDAPRPLWPLMLALGILMSMLWAFSRCLEPKKAWARASTVAVRAMIVLSFGLPGLVLAFLMLFTDHAAAFGNINIAPTLPTVLLGLIPLFRAGRRTGNVRRRMELILSWIWTVNLAALCIVMILRLAGTTIQDAYALWAFYIPILLTTSRIGLFFEERLIRDRIRGNA